MPRPAWMSNLAGRRRTKRKRNIQREGWEEEKEEEEEEEEEEESVWGCWDGTDSRMNHLQGLFLLSFFSIFTLLVAAAYFVSAKLAAAGYDISRLILIGLDHRSTSLHPTMSLNTAYAQFVALALAVASSVFLYVKFTASLSFFSPARPLLTPPIQNVPQCSTQRSSRNSPSRRKSSSLPTLPCPSLPLLARLPRVHPLSLATALRCLVQTTCSVYLLASTSPFRPR